MNKTAVLSALGVAALTVASAVPANANNRPPRPKPPVLDVSGLGTWTIAEDGSAVVTGKVDGQTLSGDLAAVLTPIDGTLPDPETCEPAMATFTIANGPRPDLVLAGAGDVCGVFPQPPTSTVLHVFTGRYRVLDAKRAKIRGTDGFFEVRLGQDNVGSSFAIDT
jgi:hypothetical protein